MLMRPSKSAEFDGLNTSRIQMNQVDFGKLIASLRKENEGEDGAPWTQEQLSQEANLAAGSSIFSEDIISSAERGRRKLERQTLMALATALQLTSDERKEFFLAASGINTSEIARQENDPEEVYSQVLESIKELYIPAVVINSYCDVLAVNHILLELLEFPSAYGITPGVRYDQPHGYNLLRFIFSEDGSNHFLKLMGKDFPDFAYTAVSMFRTFSLAYRSTDYFQDLLSELRKSRLFKRYWSDIYLREKDRQFNTAKIRANSPRWGALSMIITTRTALTTAGEVHLAVFVPTDINTANITAEISNQGSTSTIFNLTPWPNESNLK
jgi:hypothetical protein